MSIEIERKFLINGPFKSLATAKRRIAQGFLSTVPERTVRIRIQDDIGFITVKGISNNSGTTRFEWEKEIALKEAEQLLDLAEPTIIEKTRYFIPTSEGLLFEVDVFEGANEGLIVAEIELPDENTEFSRPDWLGKEVTGDIRYYNSMLSKKPFSIW